MVVSGWGLLIWSGSSLLQGFSQLNPRVAFELPPAYLFCASFTLIPLFYINFSLYLFGLINYVIFPLFVFRSKHLKMIHLSQSLWIGLVQWKLSTVQPCYRIWGLIQASYVRAFSRIICSNSTGEEFFTFLRSLQFLLTPFSVVQ
jgi:hypothetical protein